MNLDDEAIAERFGAEAQDLCRRKAELVLKHIQEDGLTPVDTGRMLEGYRVEDTEDGAELVTDVYYWKYVEFEAQGRPARPHVRPAYEAMRLEE